MPTSLSLPLRAALAFAFATAASLFMFTAGSHAAPQAPVDLRVVAPTGATLAEQTQLTGSVKVKTDRKARCFGPGNEGSGDRVRVPGYTPLGALVDGASNQKRLRPISVTDAFDFGLGVCGVGGFDFGATEPLFWYVKQDHTGLQVGADQAELDRGDSVLWALVDSSGEVLPPELELIAEARTKPGPLEVQVYEYADDGTRSPAQGAAVSGAEAPTDATGKTTVDLSAPGTAKLRATRPADGAIPSNVARVCIAQELSACPKEPGRVIGGSAKRDFVVGTVGPDRIKTKGGNDRIDALDGEQDRISCGGGRDFVAADPVDRLKRCERVKR